MADKDGELVPIPHMNKIGTKKVLGCRSDKPCKCTCRSCKAGTIVLVTTHVTLETTISDLQGDPIPSGRIVRISPDHQLAFIKPKAAKELKRLLEEE